MRSLAVDCAVCSLDMSDARAAASACMFSIWRAASASDQHFRKPQGQRKTQHRRELLPDIIEGTLSGNTGRCAAARREDSSQHLLSAGSRERGLCGLGERARIHGVLL